MQQSSSQDKTTYIKTPRAIDYKQYPSLIIKTILLNKYYFLYLYTVGDIMKRMPTLFVGHGSPMMALDIQKQQILLQV